MKNIVLTACALMLAGSISDVRAEEAQESITLIYTFSGEDGKVTWPSSQKANITDGMFNIPKSNLNCNLTIVIDGDKTSQKLNPILECKDSSNTRVIDKQWAFSNSTAASNYPYNLSSCFKYKNENDWNEAQFKGCLYATLKTKDEETSYLKLTINESTNEKKETTYSYDGSIQKCTSCDFSK